jgi:hypothetical protein
MKVDAKTMASHIVRLPHSSALAVLSFSLLFPSLATPAEAPKSPSPTTKVPQASATTAPNGSAGSTGPAGEAPPTTTKTDSKKDDDAKKATAPAPPIVTVTPGQIPVGGAVKVEIQKMQGGTSADLPMITMCKAGEECLAENGWSPAKHCEVRITKSLPDDLVIMVNLPPEKKPGNYVLRVVIGKALDRIVSIRVVSALRAAALAMLPVALLLAVAALTALIVRGRPNPLAFAISATGRSYSLSKFQILLWTIVVGYLASYVWFATDTLLALSGQILGLMGIATVSSLTAKGIGVAKGQATPTKQDNRTPQIVDLLMDEDDFSLAKLQMLFWTLFIAGIVIAQTITNLELPALDTNLLLLMGISQGTYLFGEVTNSVTATKAPLKLVASSPATMSAATLKSITVTGLGLGSGLVAELIPADPRNPAIPITGAPTSAAGDMATLTIATVPVLTPGQYGIRITDKNGNQDTLIGALTVTR